jgi:hypothetical protein
MDRAFTFTNLVWRCFNIEVEMWALSISIRHTDLGAFGSAVTAFDVVGRNIKRIRSEAETVANKFLKNIFLVLIPRGLRN